LKEKEALKDNLESLRDDFLSEYEYLAIDLKVK